MAEQDEQEISQKNARLVFKWGVPTLIIIYVASLVFCGYEAWHSKDLVVVVAVGAFWLGVVVGMMLGFFVQEVRHFSQRAFKASVAAIGGAALLVLFRFSSSMPQPEIWFYPMGIVGGFIVGTIWELAYQPGKKSS